MAMNTVHLGCCTRMFWLCITEELILGISQKSYIKNQVLHEAEGEE